MANFLALLELEPLAFARQPRPSPSRSFAEVPEAWRDYWRASLADAGIDELEPIGAQHVALADVRRESTLQAIVERALEGFDSASDLEVLGPLCGGFLLRADGKELWPGCCSDLSNLVDWQTALEANPAWRMLWIGHPWVFCRRQGSMLELSQPTEEDVPPAGALMAVEMEEMVRLVDLASHVLDDFEARLRSVLASIHPRRAAEIAEVLVRGHSA